MQIPNGRDTVTDRDYAPLVTAAAGGDAEAMENLLSRVQRVAYRFSMQVCGQSDDAQDCAQDVLLKTYRNVGRIRDPRAFPAWLFRTVRNVCLMSKRRHVAEPARLISIEQGTRGGSAIDVVDTSSRPDEIAIRTAVAARLRAAIRALPPTYRTIVRLREVEGLSTSEVAAATGLSEANVKTRLHRAHARLRAELQDR